MATFHSLDLRFYPVPVGFHVLGMDPGCRVDELDAVVHSTLLFLDEHVTGLWGGEWQHHGRQLASLH